MPGVGVSVLRRDLPTTSITGSLATSNDSLIISDLSLKTTVWRLTASKSLILFTMAAGVGQDIYDASTKVSAVVHNVPVFNRVAVAPLSISDRMTRLNYFADISMNLVALKVIGEIGMASGGTASTFNTFSTAADASRLYGSLGVRFGL